MDVGDGNVTQIFHYYQMFQMPYGTLIRPGINVHSINRLSVMKVTRESLNH